MFSQEEKERVIKIIEKARTNALCDRAVDELCVNGLQLELDPEDQAIADSLTEDELLPEDRWLEVEKMDKDWEECCNPDNPNYVHDPRFDPEPLDDTFRFLSN